MSILYGRLSSGQIKPKAVLERLWLGSTGDSDEECWEFHGKCTGSGGHKRIRLNSKDRIFVHRLAWEAYHAEPVPEGLLVLHHCDNAKCFNPHHLYVGTHQNNVDDKFARSRANPPRKVSEKDTALIRVSTASTRELSEMYGVTPRRIRQIRRGE